MVAKEIAVAVGAAAAFSLGAAIYNSQNNPNNINPINEDEDDMSAAIPTLQEILGQLNTISNQLSRIPDINERLLFIEIVTVGTTPTNLYSVNKKVVGGSIQNLSTTDSIALGSQIGNTGKPLATLTATKGFILNPAAAAGLGGGIFNFSNMDLSTLSAVSSTNNNQSLLVAYYI